MWKGVVTNPPFVRIPRDSQFFLYHSVKCSKRADDMIRYDAMGSDKVAAVTEYKFGISGKGISFGFFRPCGEESNKGIGKIAQPCRCSMSCSFVQFKDALEKLLPYAPVYKTRVHKILVFPPQPQFRLRIPDIQKCFFTRPYLSLPPNVFPLVLCFAATQSIRTFRRFGSALVFSISLSLHLPRHTSLRGLNKTPTVSTA